MKYVHLKPLAKIELEDGAPVSTDALFQLTEAGMSLKMENNSIYNSAENKANSKPSAVESEFSGVALWNLGKEKISNLISDKPFKCEFCESKFKRNYDKNRHMKMNHLNEINGAGNQANH